MRRRLTIARSLVNEPEILLLDEPTTGLDPQARHILWDRLFRLKQQGVTLILTTHYMDEAEQLCDRLVVMDSGRIVAEGSPRELINRYSTRDVLELRFAIGEQATAEEKVRAAGTERIEALPDRLLWYADDGEAALATAHRLGLSPVTALVRRSTLEDVFLALTGRTLVDRCHSLKRPLWTPRDGGTTSGGSTTIGGVSTSDAGAARSSSMSRIRSSSSSRSAPASAAS
jgi:lipooligosaccharide transport system ATP-binding protein